MTRSLMFRSLFYYDMLRAECLRYKTSARYLLVPAPLEVGHEVDTVVKVHSNF
jgi:hypothetical protein